MANQFPGSSDSRKECFTDDSADVVHSYVSQDAFGPLSYMRIAPDPRDESLAIADNPTSFFEVSLDVFSPVTTKKHAQLAFLLIHKTTDLGSPFFNHVPDDIE